MNDPLLKLKKLYGKARQCYYQGAPILTDQEFDSLEQKLKKADPAWLKAQRTGTVLGQKVVQALNAPMPSLDKARLEEPKEVMTAIRNISNFGTRAVLMPKLDGASVQSTYVNGKLHHLITRGNGIMGKSIMHLAPLLNIPKVIDTNLEKLVIRHECLMTKQAFDEAWSGVFDSARAVANGLLNRQTAHDAMADLDFVCIKVLFPKYSVGDGLDFLEKLGFLCVKRKEITLPKTRSELDNLTTSFASLIQKLDDTHPYLVDGLVLHSYANKLPEDTDEKPKYAYAFKRNDFESAPVTTVRSVRWSVSPYGVLVPTAIFDPLNINDTTVTKAVMHNASWALTRGVGPGARIKVLKSGEIIPRIVGVVKTAKLQLPDPALYGEYDWDETGVCLVLRDKENVPEVKAAKLKRFFDHLEVEGFSTSLAKKLVDAGHDTPVKVLRMKEADFRELPNVKDSAIKLAQVVYDLKSTPQPAYKLMVSSGAFGRGIGHQKSKLLFDTYPGIINTEEITDKGRTKLRDLLGPVTSQTVADGWPKFKRFLARTGLQVEKPQKTVKVAGIGPCTGLYGTWTGYRAKDEEYLFTKLGGTVVNYGAKTNVLFFLAEGKPSSKVAKAGAAGITVCSNAQSFFAQRCADFKRA